jgi:hypothetical protein
MANPVSEPKSVSEIGVAESLSQVSALLTANAEESQTVSPQFTKLRYYVTQMQGLILDTEA